MKLCIREVHISTQYNLSTYLQPTFFRPNSIQSSGESELFVFMFIQVFCSFFESFPACTCLCAVITDISLRQLYSEHCVCITSFRSPDFRLRHSNTVNFLRNNFEAACCFLFFRFMDILHLKLLACKHTGLEDNCHILTCYQAIFEV